ncbi:MAG: hypothetical protein GTN62_05800 [Gemmatimonadales bacterium]|nr:hypothetical protein [Gemmatimonadales bacterium]NIN11013.1 hypothetical protein [Gemmatimonadales bacterium]NIN49610.1 hypothetical protein [Gemmatimonadales bacterium]NIP07074.1 hypothetical protein [Gemmatimonadales bacterium]NIQ99465.1 hypothetical protein [Gemmatimonadales bacterium]
MKQRGTLCLKRSEIASLLTLADYVEIVESAFRLYAQGKTLDLGLLHIDSRDGEFHIKAGVLELTRIYAGVKVNAGFYQNRARYGLPNVQGTIVLCDGENGYPLAYMDSTEITINRTGATTAVAAKYLARPESRVATICGCGTQGRVQLRSLKHVLPIEEAYAFDLDEGAARGFASTMSQELGIRINAVTDPAVAVPQSDVCVTCTPSREPFLRREHVSPGMFLAAVGADSPLKHEIDPGIMASTTVVVDLLDQCSTVGELHHALERGLATRDMVHAELAEVVDGRKPGRSTPDEILVFDSTGTALQDVAAAAAAFEKAVESRKGTRLDLLGG